MSAQTYYAFGNIRSTTGTVPTDFGFTGQRRDASAGLLFYNARYYDATLGRFVSADTIVPQAGNSQALNRYSYVYNNPVRYTDPSGHCPVCAVFYAIWEFFANPSSAGGDTLVYDQENKLTSITVGGTTTTYAYDGDGNRVKKVAGSTVTYYVGNHYEVTNGVALKYYYFGKQRVAMRTTAGVVYLHGDHPSLRSGQALAAPARRAARM